MNTKDLMKLADIYAMHKSDDDRDGNYGALAPSTDARQALLDALEALGREVAELKEAADDHEQELADAAQGPWVDWSLAIMRSVRERSGYDGFDDQDGVDLPAEVEEALLELERLIERRTAERDQARAELAAIRATQEPVAYWVPKAEQFCIADKSGRPFAKAWEPLYASPVSKDAGLVADTRYQEIREALENLMAWQVKNVKVWNHPTWDNAQAVIDRNNASPKIGGV